MNLIVFVILLAGAFVMFVAGLGIYRMPDLFTRMHSSTKGASLGLGLCLLAAAILFGDLGVATKAILTTVFVFTTAPVAAHLLSRAAYTKKVPLWKHTVVDEAHGRIAQDGNEPRKEAISSEPELKGEEGSRESAS